MKKRKIIVTLGPSSLTKQVVKKMDILGVDIFRINLSHVEINEFEKTIKMVKEWTDKPVCPDSEGAQLRTGNINGNNIHLVTGSTISFIDLSGNKDKAVIPLNVQNPGELLSLGDLLRIDFNSVIVQIYSSAIFDHCNMVPSICSHCKSRSSRVYSASFTCNTYITTLF